ncbi:MAG: hypothetical protein QME96_12105 [Myxococcota bacterium]|nr:hypothetical protein [Myxococcota bacterium]
MTPGQQLLTVAEDDGEPENQRLGRDWKWVPERLNAMAAEVATLCAERDRLVEQIAAGDARAKQAEAALEAARLWLAGLRVKQIDPVSLRAVEGQIDAAILALVSGRPST